ncbi:MAG: hypothetical protein MHM6MM_001148 [Cercozoa sp. M6MM]
MPPASPRSLSLTLSRTLEYKIQCHRYLQPTKTLVTLLELRFELRGEDLPDRPKVTTEVQGLAIDHRDDDREPEAKISPKSTIKASPFKDAIPIAEVAITGHTGAHKYLLGAAGGAAALYAGQKLMGKQGGLSLPGMPGAGAPLPPPPPPPPPASPCMIL